MKKELFEKLLTFLKGKISATPTVTETEEYIGYSFQIGAVTGLYDQAAAIIKEHKFKGTARTEVFKLLYGDDIHRDRVINMQKRFLTILYNKIKDKVCVQVFDTGYGWSEKHARFYPVKIKRPVFCYNKNLYGFNLKKKPRLIKGGTQPYLTHCEYFGEIVRILMQIDFDPKVKATAKHYIGAKDNLDVLEKVYNTKIPKALKVFNIEEIEALYDTLADRNEINRICQYLSMHTHIETKEFPIHPSNITDYKIRTDVGASKKELNLYDVIVRIMKWEIEDSYYSFEASLIRDYMKDLKTLGKKFSLKISSKKRIEDEHRKMSRLIMYRGIKEFSVDKIYSDQMKAFPIKDAELITKKDRLLQESIEQDHCVATYANSINTGTCCIISIPFEGKRWTLELRKRVELKNPVTNIMDVIDGAEPESAKVCVTFSVAQLRGLRNCMPPAELTNLLYEHFKDYKIEVDQEASQKIEKVDEFIDF